MKKAILKPSDRILSANEHMRLGEFPPPYNQEKLGDLFRRIPELIMVFSTVVDHRVHMRLRDNFTPRTIYHFTKLDSLEWLAEVLGAVCGADASAPPIDLLDFHGQADIDLWRSQDEEMSVLRVADSSEMHHYMEIIHANRQKLGKVLFLASDTLYHQEQVINVPLPPHPRVLSTDEKNLLRSAVEYCTRQQFHIEVLDAWRNQLEPHMTPMIRWWAILTDLALHKIIWSEKAWSKMHAGLEVLKYLV